jgi:hypothetical protein
MNHVIEKLFYTSSKRASLAASVKFYNTGSNHALYAALRAYLDTIVPRWCPSVLVPAKMRHALATTLVVNS